MINKVASLKYLDKLSKQDILSADVKLMECKSYKHDGTKYYDITLSINGHLITFSYMTDKAIITDRTVLASVLPNRVGNDLADIEAGLCQ